MNIQFTFLALGIHQHRLHRAQQGVPPPPQIHNWGEPERAPHKWYINARIVLLLIMLAIKTIRFYIGAKAPDILGMKHAWYATVNCTPYPLIFIVTID